MRRVILRILCAILVCAAVFALGNVLSLVIVGLESYEWTCQTCGARAISLPALDRACISVTSASDASQHAWIPSYPEAWQFWTILRVHVRRPALSEVLKIAQIEGKSTVDGLLSNYLFSDARLSDLSLSAILSDLTQQSHTKRERLLKRAEEILHCHPDVAPETATRRFEMLRVRLQQATQPASTQP
jgi:hypothetical protein